jgi:hypothetical protein
MSPWMFQLGLNVMVDKNVGGRNVKTPSDMVLFLGYGQGEIERQLNYSKLYLDNIVVLKPA